MMNKHLSNHMPELTNQELLFRGSHMTRYYDIKIKSYVACNRSVAFFIHETGLIDFIETRNRINSQLSTYGSLTLPSTQSTGKEITIYI